MGIKVGINGFGRIGRVIFRACFQNGDLEVVAINDPAIDAEYICYLIKFDSTHGKLNRNIGHSSDEIIVDDHHVKVFHEKLPPSVPWAAAGVQYVIEASGMFTTLEKASGHLQSDGVKRVIITAPSVDVPMIIMGVNDFKLNPGQKVLSCASSTVYCLAPIIKLLEDCFGVTEGFVTSIHAMTPSLKPLDGLCLRGKHWRDHRSIHQNIIPAATGACKALGKIIPQVKDKMSGLAFRVPIVNVSVLDLTIRLNTNTTLEDIIKSIEKASKTNMKNIIKISNEQAVSSDFIGDTHSCIFDQDSSLQLKPDFFKLICWYENEYSYACRVIDSIFFSEKQFILSALPSKITYLRTRQFKKHDVDQTTERYGKELSIDCSYIAEVDPKMLCSTSQNAEFKTKPTQPVLLKKPSPPSPHNAKTASTSDIDRDNNKRNEMFKIWNHNNDTTKTSARQNRGSIFHSCVSFAPRCTEQTICTKAQERLENVKREFSKMVNITEDLLKKSYSSKLQLNSVVNTSKDKTISKEEFAKADNDNNKLQKSKPEIDLCGDCKASLNLIDSNILDDCSEELMTTQNSYDKDISDFGTGEIKKDDRYKSTETLSVARNSMSTNFENASKTDTTKIISDKADFEVQVAKTINTLIDGLTQNIQAHCCIGDQTKNVINKQELLCYQITEIEDTDTYTKTIVTKVNNQDNKLNDINITNLTNEILTNDIKHAKNESDVKENTTDINSHVIKEKVEEVVYNTKYDIHPINNTKYDIHPKMMDHNTLLNPDNEDLIIETDNHRKDMVLTKQILEGLNKFVPEPVIIVSEDGSRCLSPENTNTTLSNGDVARYDQDIYDKLDSASSSDSENSFEIHGRKSQVIHITDLTNSLDDLARLDNICKIIEISDELSDKLFSALDRPGDNLKHKKWSFKDLCERIKLDEFCNKVFGKTVV